MKSSHDLAKSIEEIITLIKPIYSKSGWFTDEDEEKLRNLGFDIHGTSFYDGKIIQFTFKNIDCNFAKFDSTYQFTFTNGTIVTLYEDYQYMHSDKIYNECPYEERFTSKVETITSFSKIKGCYDKCKIVVSREECH